jgi:hypothetical protein
LTVCVTQAGVLVVLSGDVAMALRSEQFLVWMGEKLSLGQEFDSCERYLCERPQIPAL